VAALKEGETTSARAVILLNGKTHLSWRLKSRSVQVVAFCFNDLNEGG
jgi:hypothetical protein